VYFAIEINGGNTRYSIRESHFEGGLWKSRDIIRLDGRPENYIVYVGDRAYYLDEEIENRFLKKGVEPDKDELDRLFRPYLKPFVREMVERFDRGKAGRSKHNRLSRQEMEDADRLVHPIDKRRLLYLRTGRMEQGRALDKPHRFFNILLNKSRDELEQMFLHMEGGMPAHEYKSYVYVMFDIQRYFTNRMTRFFPATLDQERVEEIFMEEFCSLSRNNLYCGDYSSDYVIRTYLFRYLIMFYDYDYLQENIMREYIENFMNQRRAFSPPPPKSMISGIDEALDIMGIGKKDFPSMSVKDLAKVFRRKSHDHHPDKGGEHDEFVRLVCAYEKLTEMKVRKKIRTYRRKS
jgi:hypothetical protein